jgi:hypothetical protein
VIWASSAGLGSCIRQPGYDWAEFVSVTHNVVGSASDLEYGIGLGHISSQVRTHDYYTQKSGYPPPRSIATVVHIPICCSFCGRSLCGVLPIYGQVELSFRPVMPSALVTSARRWRLNGWGEYMVIQVVCAKTMGPWVSNEL